VPVIADIGSGLLRPDPLLPDEPDAATWLAGGATVVTASGDKLLGGPQAGLVLGDADTVALLRRHPLARALRVDKITLAALEATLRGPETPTAAAVRADVTALRARCTALARALDVAGVPAQVVPSDGAVGGGAAPGQQLPGWAVRLPAHLAEPLRRGDPCVVSRVEKGHCLLDLRCIPATADVTVRAAVTAAARAPEPPCT
jgi:L-seryl-tRNA(Ser) seleniumtransferase